MGTRATKEDETSELMLDDSDDMDISCCWADRKKKTTILEQMGKLDEARDLLAKKITHYAQLRTTKKNSAFANLGLKNKEAALAEVKIAMALQKHIEKFTSLKTTVEMLKLHISTQKTLLDVGKAMADGTETLKNIAAEFERLDVQEFLEAITDSVDRTKDMDEALNTFESHYLEDLGITDTALLQELANLEIAATSSDVEYGRVETAHVEPFTPRDFRPPKPDKKTKPVLSPRQPVEDLTL